MELDFLWGKEIVSAGFLPLCLLLHAAVKIGTFLQRVESCLMIDLSKMGGMLWSPTTIAGRIL